MTAATPGFLYTIEQHRFYNALLDGQTIELGRACGDLQNMSALEAKTSENAYIRGLFALQKRCGMRSIKAMLCNEQEPIVVLLLSLRAFVEGYPCEPFSCPHCGDPLLPTEWLKPELGNDEADGET